jgi:cytochrome P450
MSFPNRLKLPPALQKLNWIINPVGYMQQAARTYPDLFTAEIVGFGDTVVFVQHPQALQEILTRDRKLFVAVGSENKILQPVLGDASVILLQGEVHKRQRQLLMPPLHGEQLRGYGEEICRITEKIFAQIPQNQTFPARTITQQISLEVVLEVVFGLNPGERYQQLKHLLTAITDIFSSPWTASFLYFSDLQQDLGAWSPWGRFVRLRQQIDQLLYAEITERRQHPNPDRLDILSLLMSARDEAGEAMSDRELRDEMMTLLIAGHETTASAMAWALYWVHRLPEVREKLLYELNSLENSQDLMALARSPYLSAVCNETLRIYPVAMLTFPRVVQEPVQLLNQPLDPGTILIGCIYLLHQRPDLYPNPQQFRPERFLERQFSPYEFMPFGGGVRRCVGDAIALFEMKLVLSTVLQRYSLTLVDQQPEYPQRRGITLTPARGVRMRREE